MSEFEKLGRKASSDPIQEKLRQNKASWNADMSSLIAKLIAFKRGLNGRGDAKAGLPPSSIKDPVPSEVGNYLNELANQYLSVVSGANSIIGEQAHYSTNRKKSQRQAALELELFVKQATWAGSRLWARITLRKLNRNIRILRFRMIKDGLELLKEFKKLEIDLAQKHTDSIPNGITQASLLAIHLQTYLEKYDELIEEATRAEGFAKAEKEDKLKSEEDIQTDETLKEAPGVAAPKILPKELQIIESPVEESHIEVPGEIFPNWEKFQKCWSEHEYMGQVVRNLINSPTMEPNKKTMRESYNTFEKVGATLFADSQNVQLSSKKLKSLFDTFFKQYDYLLNLAKEYLGKGNNFEELAKFTPLPTIASYLEFKSEKEELQKVATSTLQRWLMKQRLSFMADSQDRFILEAIEKSETTRKKLISIINLLENPESTLKQIDNEIVGFVNLTQNILAMILRLGKIHMTSGRRKQKGKDSYLTQVNKVELSQLENSIRDLFIHSQPLAQE